MPGLSISEILDFLGSSQTTQGALEFTQDGAKNKKTSRADSVKLTETRIMTLYMRGEEKSIS